MPNARDTVRLIMEDMMNLFPEFRSIKIAFLSFDTMRLFEDQLAKKSELEILTAIAKTEGRIDSFRKARVRASSK